MNVRASLARGALVTLAGVLALAADVAAMDIVTSFEGLSKTEVEAINHAVGSNPDPNLAVGPNHIFQIMNGAGRISDKTGRVISSFTLTSFFEMEYGRTGFDPRVIYDARSGRWFATYASSIGFTADGSPPPAAASVLLAVSNSSDPTAGFCQLRIGNPTTETDFKHDFPFIGVSDDKIVISYAALPVGPNGVSGGGYYILNKADVLACATPRMVRVAPQPGSMYFPAHSLDAISDLHMAGPIASSSTQLGLRTISGVPGVSPVTESFRALPIRTWLFGPVVRNIAWQADSLWLAGHEACGPSTNIGSRVCLRVMEIRTDSFTVRQDTTFNDGAPDTDYLQPSLRPDRDGNLLLVFHTRSDSNVIGVRATGRLATDALDTLQPSIEVRAGQGSQAGDSMGDYTGAAVDPTDPLTVWVTGEYLKSTTPQGEVPDWGTAIAQLQMGGSTTLAAAFTSPADEAFVNGIVTIGVSETGGTPPFRWTLRIDGGNTDVFTTSGTTSTASFGWDTSRVMRGRHYLSVEVQDATGRKAAAPLTIVVADPLSASFTSPAEGATVNGTVAVEMNQSGAVGSPFTFTLTIDGAQVFTTSGTFTTVTYNWNTAGYANGSHTLRLTVSDSAGRTATATRTVTVGTGSLRVAITQPGADGATVSGSTWFVLWVEGAAAGTKTYTLTAGGKQLATTNDTSSGPISMAWDTRQLNSGSNTVIASVRDSAGNIGSAARVVNVSNCEAAFAASITSPAEGATVGGTVPVTMAEAGACATPITFTLTLDGTQVFTTSGTATSASFNWITGAGGPHTLVLTVRDGTGSTASVIRHVSVGPPPGPQPIFTSPPEGATVSGVVTVGMSRGDTGTGTINWTLKIDGTTVFTETSAATSRAYSWNTGPYAAGPHTLTLTLQDPSSGSSTTATRNVTVAGPLTASITSPAEGATVSGLVTISMSETNATSGTIIWTLQLDGGSTPIFSTSGPATTQSFNWDTSGVAPGAHQLQLTVQDGGGRMATATRNVTVGSPGMIKVFITQPGTDGTTVSGTVWFTIWLENASGSRTLTLSIDGAAVATTSTTSNGPISMPWNSTGTSGGMHTATVSVRDSVNNTGSANRTVVIAGCPPGPFAVSITSPTEGATVSGTVPVNMLVSGACGTPIAFTLTIDGVQVFTTSGAATTASFNWNTAGAASAPTLVLTVRDGAGDQASATRHVTVSDVPPPPPIFTSPAEGATVSGTITVAASVAGRSAPFTWTVKVDNTTQIFTQSGTPTSISFSWNTTTVPDGSHTLNLTVQDSTGATATAVRNITVQQPPPAMIKVYITEPGADGATVSGTTWFTIWIENAAGGNKTYTMSVGNSPVATTNTTSNGPVSIPWNTAGTPNGSQSVTVGVRDSAAGTGQAVRVVNVSN